MPVVKATIKDIVKAPVGEGTVTFVSYDIRAAAEGGSVITAPGSWAQPIEAGVALTPSLDPGLYEVEISIGWFVEKYNIVVPAVETEQQLKTLIDEFLALPPETPAVRLAAAIGSYFAENPVEGAGPSQDNVAPLISASGATRTAVDTRVQTVGDTLYAPVSPDTGITYNSDGSVATVTENGVTTSYTYNSDGTVATDVRAGVTRTYTYDGSGNLTEIAS